MPDKIFLKYHFQLVLCQDNLLGLWESLSPDQVLKTKSIGRDLDIDHQSMHIMNEIAFQENSNNVNLSQLQLC